jgi:hypothetical protein
MNFFILFFAFFMYTSSAAPAAIIVAPMLSSIVAMFLCFLLFLHKYPFFLLLGDNDCFVVLSGRKGIIVV